MLLGVGAALAAGFIGHLATVIEPAAGCYQSPSRRGSALVTILAMLWLKALHVVFVVTWFAGLFYLPRLFVYHVVTRDGPGPRPLPS